MGATDNNRGDTRSLLCLHQAAEGPAIASQVHPALWTGWRAYTEPLSAGATTWAPHPPRPWRCRPQPVPFQQLHARPRQPEQPDAKCDHLQHQLVGVVDWLQYHGRLVAYFALAATSIPASLTDASLTAAKSAAAFAAAAAAAAVAAARPSGRAPRHRHIWCD